MNFRSFRHFLEFLNNNKSRNELWRQHYVTVTSAGSTGPARVKPDVWGPHVSDTGANPALTRALTRYGARCQCLWGVFSVVISAN